MSQSKQVKGKKNDGKGMIVVMEMIFGMVSRRSGWSVRVRNVGYGCQ